MFLCMIIGIVDFSDNNCPGINDAATTELQKDKEAEERKRKQQERKEAEKLAHKQAGNNL